MCICSPGFGRRHSLHYYPLDICLSTYLPIYLSICPSVCLPVCLSVCLCVCVSVYLFVWVAYWSLAREPTWRASQLGRRRRRRTYVRSWEAPSGVIGPEGRNPGVWGVEGSCRCPETPVGGREGKLVVTPGARHGAQPI